MTAAAAVIRKPLEIDPSEPLPAARLFVDRHYTVNKQRTLHHHAGVFYEWNGTRYEIADYQTMRGKVYVFLETASRRTPKGKLVPFQPNMAKVSNVVDAIEAVSNVPRSVNPPAWLVYEDEYPPAGEIVSCLNGLLHLPSRDLTPATPAFFAVNGLDFAFDAEAPAPSEWLKFLTSLWPDVPEAIQTLQDWFGYCLTGDTRQHKILLVVGPKRSGKGTIARVLTALLGQSNVSAPTLASLGQNFGLAPLIGKQLAIIADARLSSRADQQAIAERLLSISGEDGVTVDRKFQDLWTGRLTTRFMVMTNELPRIADSSGALASRFVLLTLRRSFFGIEDHGLTERLLAELPGILNWAIEGWRSLRERGRFIQPASSAEAIRELEDLGSPIGAFLRERCEVGAGHQVECTRLFIEWRQWCEDQGRDHPGTVQSFGRDLRAAVAGLAVVQLRADGDRERRYSGLMLKRDHA